MTDKILVQIIYISSTEIHTQRLSVRSSLTEGLQGVVVVCCSDVVDLICLGIAKMPPFPRLEK